MAHPFAIWYLWFGNSFLVLCSSSSNTECVHSSHRHTSLHFDAVVDIVLLSHYTRCWPFMRESCHFFFVLCILCMKSLYVVCIGSGHQLCLFLSVNTSMLGFMQCFQASADALLPCIGAVVWLIMRVNTSLRPILFYGFISLEAHLLSWKSKYKLHERVGMSSETQGNGNGNYNLSCPCVPLCCIKIKICRVWVKPSCKAHIDKRLLFHPFSNSEESLRCGRPDRGVL